MNRPSLLLLAALLLPACGGGTSSDDGVSPSPAAPPAPAILGTSSSHGLITLTWSPVANATSYTIYLARSPGVTKANWATLPGGARRLNATTPALLGGLTNGLPYYMVVTASSGSAESIESTEATATPIAVPPPPTGISATPGDQQVTVTWNASAGATSYALYRATESGVTKASYALLAGGTRITGVSSPYVDTGRVNGTT